MQPKPRRSTSISSYITLAFPPTQASPLLWVSSSLDCDRPPNHDPNAYAALQPVLARLSYTTSPPSSVLTSAFYSQSPAQSSALPKMTSGAPQTERLPPMSTNAACSARAIVSHLDGLWYLSTPRSWWAYLARKIPVAHVFVGPIGGNEDTVLACRR
ncbi:hypothetical protein MIND_01117000 [Mycena indigotica]|uniref:Uncharacterized protein n=1 Tax=Mycena indigotica TaxID=2126181 RepID=A0A8H6S744_9AGAR|nr:uncharacterized protein MIND_01117000 [Mycena indigotica]KAF7293400.1 hypothetical protein MIND_01117000 [Mycena indigotica]